MHICTTDKLEELWQRTDPHYSQ